MKNIVFFFMMIFSQIIWCSDNRRVTFCMEAPPVGQRRQALQAWYDMIEGTSERNVVQDNQEMRNKIIDLVNQKLGRRAMPYSHYDRAVFAILKSRNFRLICTDFPDRVYYTSIDQEQFTNLGL